MAVPTDEGATENVEAVYHREHAVFVEHRNQRIKGKNGKSYRDYGGRHRQPLLDDEHTKGRKEDQGDDVKCQM